MSSSDPAATDNATADLLADRAEAAADAADSSAADDREERDDSDTSPTAALFPADTNEPTEDAVEETIDDDAADTDRSMDDEAEAADDLEAQLQAELDVHAQIAEHLAAIQRLRGIKPMTRARLRQPPPAQPASQAQLDDIVAPRAPMARLASISLQRSAPDVADVLRTRRALRSFMQHNRSRSEFSMGMQLDFPVPPAVHQRDPSSTSSLSLQIPDRNGCTDADEEHAALIEVEPLYASDAATGFVLASHESPASARSRRSARASPHSSFRHSRTHSRQSSGVLPAHVEFPRSAEPAAPADETDSDESPESQRIAESAPPAAARHDAAAASDMPERIFDSLFAPVSVADDPGTPPHAADEAEGESVLMQHRSSLRRRSNGATLLRSKSPSPLAARSPHVASVRHSPAASPNRSPIASAAKPPASSSEASPVTAALPPRSPMQPSLLSLGPFVSPPSFALAAAEPIGLSSMTEPPVGSTLAVPSSPNSAELNVSAPGLNRATSLPPSTIAVALDGDMQLSAAKSTSATPPSLSRTASTLAPVSVVDKAAPAISHELLSVCSPPSAISVSPLSPSTWLQRRMGRIFQQSSPADCASHSEDAGEENLGAQVFWRAVSCLPAIIHVLLPCIILFQSITLPVRLAFGSDDETSSEHSSFAAWRTWDLPLDTIFLLGVLFSDYVDPSTLTLRGVLRRPGSARRAAWISLTVDLISALPLEFLGVSRAWVRESGLWHDPALATSVRIDALVRLPRLLRLARLFSFLDACETRNLVVTWISPTLFRLFKLGTLMYLFAHLAGCGYVLIGIIEGLPAGNLWICPEHIRNQPLSAQYLHAIYWGLSAMTGNGSGVESPNTLLEHAFALFVLLVGVSTYAALIGNLSNIMSATQHNSRTPSWRNCRSWHCIPAHSVFPRPLLVSVCCRPACSSSMNSRQDDFRSKMTSITNLMTTYHLPEEVQSRVKSCFQYMFVGGALAGTAAGGEDDASGMPRSSSAAGTQEWDVLEYLPAYLRNEVLVYLNGEIIQKVPLFRGCSDGFVRSLVPLLRPEVVIPGDFIIRTGEIGREMYLIRHGIVEVLAHGVVVATLSDGSYVGEVAVMFEQKRTASVRAQTFCDILVLSKEAFDSVLSQYPSVQRSMKMQATMRRNARSMQDKEHKVQEIEKAMAVRREAQEGAAVAKRNASAAATRSPRPASSITSKTRIMVTPVGSRTPRTLASSASRAPYSAASSSSARHSPESKPMGSPAAANIRRRSAGPFTPSDSAAAASRSDSSSLAAPSGPDQAASLTASSASATDPSAVVSPPSDFTAGSAASALVPADRAPKSKWKKLRLLTRGQ